MHAYMQFRPLAYAVVLSLGAHAVLFMPWRYGSWLAKGTFHSGQTIASPRLDVQLTQAAPNPRQPSPLAAPEPVQPVPEEQKPLPSAPPQREPTVSETPAGIPLDALYYYAVKELDKRPLLKQAPQFDAAANGPRLAVSGSAVLELLIERNGRINAVNVVRSDIPESYLLPLIEAFADVRYSPGYKAQAQVRSRLYVEVAYRDGMFSGMDAGASASVPPAPMDNLGSIRQRKENPPVRD